MQSDERLKMERAIQAAAARVQELPDRIIQLIYGILRAAEILTE